MGSKKREPIDADDDAGGDKEDKKVSSQVLHWLSEVEAAKNREKDYRSDGRRVREIYCGEKKDETPFNILFSNTETILPSMYSQTPRPVVTRRYKDGDRVGTAAAKAAQCFLEFALDTNIDGYETFNDVMKAATMDGLLPGRGIASVKYDAEMYKETVKAELVCCETQSWNRVYFGFARKWSKVPWVAIEMQIDKPEALRLFGREKTSLVRFSKGLEDDDSDGARPSKGENQTGERKTALIYQIWDKSGGRKVRYVSPQYTDGYLLVEEDPLELTGFFNVPRPIQFIEKTDSTVPVSMYSLYENQAIELNRISLRINRMIQAVKARGIYDSELGEDLANLMEADDNALVPAEKGSSLAAEKGLSNAIWFMPLDVIITTLRELYAAREACKQVIYEIMGISDILRGSSKASETLGAQQIKNQWGSLRLKPKQAEVQRFARDLMRMMLEIAASKFSEDTWARMTGLPYLTQMQSQQLLQTAQAAKQAAMKPSPDPRQPNPAIAQYKQLAEQAKNSITWVQVIEVLRDDLQRAYKIDIETNSTVEPEAAEDQKNIAELMNAMAQFLNGVGPMVLQGVLPFGVAKNMLLAISRRFRFGDEIEEDIKGMQPPQPPPEKGKEGDSGAEAQVAVAKVEQKAAADKLQFDSTVAKLQSQLQAAMQENQMIARKNDLDVRELKISMQGQVQSLEHKTAGESLKQKAQHESGKLTLQAKTAQLSAKAAAGGAKPASQKTGGAATPTPQAPMDGGGAQDLGQLAGMLEQVASGLGQVMQAMQAQAQASEALQKAVRAPKRKRAVRGKDGKIAEIIEEAMDEGVMQ